jgi:hypothetical protein
MADEQNTGGAKWFRLGPVEYGAVALVLVGAGTFFSKMNEKIESLTLAVPMLLEKQSKQGDDIDQLGVRVDQLTREITDMRIREAEDRGRKSVQQVGTK